MKTIKQIITVVAFAIFMMGTFNVNAQEKQETKVAEGFSVEIPDFLKPSTTQKQNHKLITASKYDKELGGYVYVTGFIDANGEVKLTSILTPIKLPKNNTKKMTPYQSCAMGCTQSPTTLGVILCTGYCMILY